MAQALCKYEEGSVCVFAGGSSLWRGKVPVEVEVERVLDERYWKNQSDPEYMVRIKESAIKQSILAQESCLKPAA